MIYYDYGFSHGAQYDYLGLMPNLDQNDGPWLSQKLQVLFMTGVN